MQTPVLMYHEITDVSLTEIPIEERPYVITSTTFEDHLEHLSKEGIACESIQTIQNADKKAVIITFDDGNASDAFVALPMLQKYGFIAEFYITTGWIGKPGYLRASDIRQLEAAGMVLGTHGVSHRYFDDLAEAEVRRELLESKMVLEDIVGHAIIGGSAPGGRIHPRTKLIASEIGYKYLCVSKAALADITSTHEFRYIPRFVVARALSLKQYSRLTSGNRRTIFAQSARTKFLGLAKRALGNRNYDKIRRRLLPKNNSD